MRPRLPAQDPSDHEHQRPPSVVRPDLVTMAPTAQHPHPEVLAEVGRERLHLGEVVDLAKGLLNLAQLGLTPDVVPRQRCAHRDLTVALPLHAGGFQRPPRRGEGIARPSLSQGVLRLVETLADDRVLDHPREGDGREVDPEHRGDVRATNRRTSAAHRASQSASGRDPRCCASVRWPCNSSTRIPRRGAPPPHAGRGRSGRRCAAPRPPAVTAAR